MVSIHYKKYKITTFADTVDFKSIQASRFCRQIYQLQIHIGQKCGTCYQQNIFGGDNLSHVVNFQSTLQLLCNVSYEITYIFIVELDFHQSFSEFAEILLGKHFELKYNKISAG